MVTTVKINKFLYFRYPCFVIRCEHTETGNKYKVGSLTGDNKIKWSSLDLAQSEIIDDQTPFCRCSKEEAEQYIRRSNDSMTLRSVINPIK